MSAGVLSGDQILAELIKTFPARIKCNESIDEEGIDPSAIDLPVSESYYEMKASCRPGPGCTVNDLIQRYKSSERLSLAERPRLKFGTTYLVELPWALDLPPQICARATAKSSIGRLDALVRLIADYEHEYETVQQSEHASSRRIYLEIRPNTFDLLLRPKRSLSQIRFFRGDERHCTISPDLLQYESPPPLINDKGERAEGRPVVGDPDSLYLTLNLADDPALGFCGFSAKARDDMPKEEDGSPVAIDPFRHETTDGEPPVKYDPKEFWDPVPSENGSVCIKANRFYIFRSKERFQIPAHLAVDCRAVSESLGDIRIHYAGFAHPFFGTQRDSRLLPGAPLIFEVRGYQFDTILHDGTALAKIAFRRMSEKAILRKRPSYTNQELTLSKCFADWVV